MTGNEYYHTHILSLSYLLTTTHAATQLLTALTHTHKHRKQTAETWGGVVKPLGGQCHVRVDSVTLGWTNTGGGSSQVAGTEVADRGLLEFWSLIVLQGADLRVGSSIPAWFRAKLLTGVPPSFCRLQTQRDFRSKSGCTCLPHYPVYHLHREPACCCCCGWLRVQLTILLVLFTEIQTTSATATASPSTLPSSEVKVTDLSLCVCRRVRVLQLYELCRATDRCFPPHSTPTCYPSSILGSRHHCDVICRSRTVKSTTTSRSR